MAIDPDSFRGKVWLLAIDKVVLGAIIAIAFVAYDMYRTRDARQYDALTKETQLAFERARLANEVLPIITSRENDVMTRGFTLGELVRAGGIPANAAIAVGPGLLADGLPALDFVQVMEPTVPRGIAAIGRRGQELWSNLSELSDRKDSPGRYDLRTFSSSIDDPNQEELSAIAREVGAWSQLLLDLHRRIGPSDCGLVDAPIVSQYSWAGIFFLLAPRMSPGLAEEFSHSPCQTFRIVGNIEKFLIDGNDQRAAAAVASVIIPKTLGFHERKLSSDVLGILLSLGPPSGESLAEPLARVLVEPKFWSSRTDPQEMSLNDVQYCAAELLGAMVLRRKEIGGPRTFTAERVLCEFLSKSGEQLNNTTVENIIERQAEDATRRNVEKYAVKILRVLDSSDGSAAVSKFLSIDSRKLNAAGLDGLDKK